MENLEKTESSSSDDSSGAQQSEPYFPIERNQIPIIYADVYNISFYGLENMHNFDSKKYGKIFAILKDKNFITDSRRHVTPKEPTKEMLLKVHTQEYLNKLKWSFEVAKVIEIGFVAALPNSMIQKKVLKPFRTQTGGSILAAKLAVERGWAINIGGGFHHCSSNKGGGFCAYADITLCIKFAQEQIEGINNVMIVDLDAHQGNGHERDFFDDEQVYIMDVYNRQIYPHDTYAKAAIKRPVELSSGTEDELYLSKVSNALQNSLRDFEPDLLVYNAGTDILIGDPLGCLKITPEGIAKRDEMVFSAAKSKHIPIVMLTSGGYLKATAKVIANSILNLHTLGLID